MTGARDNSSAVRLFLKSEAAGGILLMGAAVAAMIAANSPVAGLYTQVLQTYLGPLSVLHWVNDGLMAVFFFLVGLEIKREFVAGHLATWSDRILPMFAAAGGMAVPAVVYLFVTRDTQGLGRGWAIPSATDIAFAIGVVTLLGKRVPISLKLFLTTVAIVDDMGAVAIIALAYTDNIRGIALLAALLIMGVMFVLNRTKVTHLAPYLLLALALWGAIFMSGVHATIAGVLAACMIPIRNTVLEAQQSVSPLHRLEHALHPWVAYAIVPLFGFANAGVSLAGLGLEHVLAPLPLGIALGLFLGKQVGIFSTVWICVQLRLTQKPSGATWAQVYGIALLCGIGFTMSLFIGGLAFKDPLLLDEVKIGVLGGSVISAVVGYSLLRLSGREPE
ncbi:MAG: Na+/H+ antiporter NhaA [Proteobacteria bacterium]|nr:Na+/H+ antiporter NhaA [Pseudomonadota bacterium]